MAKRPTKLVAKVEATAGRAPTASAQPIDIIASTAEQIDAQAKRIETARQTLADLASLVVEAVASLAGLSPDASDDALQAAIQAENDVREKLNIAVAEARGLLGVPDGEMLPAALLEELAELGAIDAAINVEIPAGPQDRGQAEPGSTIPEPEAVIQGLGEGAAKDAPLEPGAVAGASDTHTTSEGDELEGEAGDLAGLTQADIDRMVALEVVRVGESVRAAFKLDPATALAHLAEERRRAQLMISMAGLLNAELAAIELELTRTETVWPLTVILFDGAEQPIGEPLLVDVETFAALTTSGAASDVPPDTHPQAE